MPLKIIGLSTSNGMLSGHLTLTDSCSSGSGCSYHHSLPLWLQQPGTDCTVLSCLFLWFHTSSKPPLPPPKYLHLYQDTFTSTKIPSLPPGYPHLDRYLQQRLGLAAALHIQASAQAAEAPKGAEPDSRRLCHLTELGLAAAEAHAASLLLPTSGASEQASTTELAGVGCGYWWASGIGWGRVGCVHCRWPMPQSLGLAAGLRAENGRVT